MAHIRGPAVATGTGRLRGYRRALARHDRIPDPRYITSGQYGDNTGYEAMQALLKLDPLPDGVFCYNDPVAAGAIKAILEANLRVPEDIAIIGAGNVHYSDLLRVPLSSGWTRVRHCIIGETAADLLAQCMESAKPPTARHIFIPPRLVVRDSSRRKE